MGSLAQPTTPQFHSPETTTNHPNPASWMPPIPTHLSPTFPSTLYKHVQNLLNNGSWENHACFFFYAILLHFLFIKQKLCDYLRRCGALRTSPLLPTPRSSVFWSPLSLSVSLSHNLSFPPEFLWFLLMSVSFSYRCGAPIGGVAMATWVFQVLLDAVVDLQEVVVPLRGVIGGCRSACLAFGERVHGQLSGGQRPKGLQAHWRCLARVRGICRTGRGARAASITVAVAWDACDGCPLEVVGGSCPHTQLPMSVDEHVHS